MTITKESLLIMRYLFELLNHEKKSPETWLRENGHKVG